MGSNFGCLRSAGLNLGWQRHICVGLKVRGLDEIKNWFLEYLDIKREQMRRDQQRRMRSINMCLGVIHGEDNGTPLQYSCLENPWTEEPGRLQSMGSLRVGHD